jgi:dihydrofolate reductase
LGDHVVFEGGIAQRAIEREHISMRKLIVSEWVSLDGVFDADTMKEWFHPYNSKDRQERITEMVLSSDAFLFGRVTYEMLAGYWPKVKNNDNGDLEVANRLNSAPKYVVSSTLKRAEWSNSTIINNGAVKKITDLKQQPGHNLLVFGSATLVESLIDADLIDEYRLLVHPIIMGSGKRAFKDGMATAKLTLGETKTLSSGVIALCYQRAKN